MLTSAYVGYGVASLDQDAAEIHVLVDLLDVNLARRCDEVSDRLHIMAYFLSCGIYTPRS